MYKIVLADDEGIVLESLQFIINKHFQGEFEIETAKSGRRVIELAETFHPDIAFVDIQMTGINGLEAMREIRKTNEQIVLIVLTAYDIFDYAKQSINLGVLEFLNKPIQQTEIVEVLHKAMEKVDEKRELRRKELASKEQIESIRPVLEKCFLDGILFPYGEKTENKSIQESLGIQFDYAYFLLIQMITEDKICETDRLNQTMQKDVHYIREQIKSVLLLSDKHITEQGIIIGSFEQFRIPVMIQAERKEEWSEQKKAILNMYLHSLAKKLESRYGLTIRFGVGNRYSIEESRKSYYGALEAMERMEETVCYQQECQKPRNTSFQKLANLEQQMLNAAIEGAWHRCIELSEVYLSYWQSRQPLVDYALKLKVLELVLLIEKQIYEPSQLTVREDYLSHIQSIRNLSELKSWLGERLEEACQVAILRKDKNSKSIIARGKEYIEENFQKDISLTDIAEELKISPHYFSRLFKEKVGMNYIEYLTNIRISFAKKSLLESNESIQNICSAAGYTDPNYFSRIFKKYVGMTPTEYKEGRIL